MCFPSDSEVLPDISKHIYYFYIFTQLNVCAFWCQHLYVNFFEPIFCRSSENTLMIKGKTILPEEKKIYIKDYFPEN